MVYGSMPKLETIKLQVLGVELTSSIMLDDTQWINEVLHLRLSDLRWEIIRRSCSLGQLPEPFQVASLAIVHNKNNHLFVGNNIIKPSKELGPNSVHSLCSGNTRMVLMETMNSRCMLIPNSSCMWLHKMVECKWLPMDVDSSIFAW